jgi:deazaflavin-dependent oxidoreductase (nitroreductase family)
VTRRRSRRERLLQGVAASRAGGWWFVNVAMRIDRVLLPVTGGRLSASIGQPVGLLKTIGAKSGEPRSTPLLYSTRADDVILVASKAGSPRNPAWYHNVRAHPEVELLAPGGLTGRYIAREAQGTERDELWQQSLDLYSGYDAYQERTDRRIPVVVLERVSAG